jgi:hypothetical protein
VQKAGAIVKSFVNNNLFATVSKNHFNAGQLTLLHPDCKAPLNNLSEETPFNNSHNLHRVLKLINGRSIQL